MTSYVSKHFTHDQVKGMLPEFIEKLDEFQDALPFKVILTSGHRPGDKLSHGQGIAADYRIRGGWQRQVSHDVARKVGFTRIGLYDNHVHLDIGKPPNFPENVTWVGESE